MLSFVHVSFCYPHASAPALDSVSLELAQGQRIALLGANGSGKSTIARLANGLLVPSGGSVQVDGFSTTKVDDVRALRQLCGVVAQDPDSQIVTTTVFDEVAFGPQNLGLERAEIFTRVAEALTAVALDELAERDPNTLSGGEKQRLVIAGILAMRPRYIVFDEPTSMLDAQGRQEVLASIRELQRAGCGILHITHRLEEACEADAVIVLDEGRIVFNDARKAFEQEEDLAKRFKIEAPVLRPVLAPVPTQASVCVPTQASMPTCASAQAPVPMRGDRGSTQEHQEHKECPGYRTDRLFSKGAALCLEDIHYTYSAGTSFEHQALKGIDLTVQPGTLTLIVGHTGSGKSTLLRIMAGLLTPSEGVASLKSVGEKSTIKPGVVGLAFQHPESQLFAQTVFDDIAFGPRNLGLVNTAEETKQAVQDACALVGFEYTRFAQRSPFTLSGGEARRCALAGILAMKPCFLLLDEPTAGLDAPGHYFVAELIQSLRAQGIGVVVVSHEVDFFTPQADVIMRLERGRCVEVRGGS